MKRLGLCWDPHLDFERELILLRQQLVDGEVSENLKTERSLRDVRMFRLVKLALASLAMQNRCEVNSFSATGSGSRLRRHGKATRRGVRRSRVLACPTGCFTICGTVTRR